MTTHFWSEVEIPAEGGSLSPKAMRADYIIDANGCWVWQKTLTKSGYATGSFTAIGIKTNWAHRAYWMVANGPIPDGHEIHHTCKTTTCVNPAHLELIGERAHDVESFLTDRAGGLTLDDVAEIRRLGRIQGYTSHQVAEMFGIHWRTVDDYWGGRRWAAEFGGGPCRPVGPCAHCGETFTAMRSRKQRFCSPSCRTKYGNERRAA